MCLFRKKQAAVVYSNSDDSINRIYHELQQGRDGEHLTVRSIQYSGYPEERLLIMLVSERGWLKLLKSRLWERVEKYLLGARIERSRKLHREHRER